MDVSARTHQHDRNKALKQAGTAIILLGIPLCGLVRITAFGQTPTDTTTSIPRLLRFAGNLPGHHGSVTSVTFAIHDSESSAAASWQETQNVAVDGKGHFDALLGATTATGIPLFVFSSESERWLSIRVDGVEASARVRLVSVPYAIRAADADTLGGLPASAFLLAEPANVVGAGQPTLPTQPRIASSGTSTTTTIPQFVAAPALTSGSASHIAKFSNTTDLINSQIYDNGTNVGVGTTAPVAKFDVESVSTVGQSAFLSNVTVANTSPVNGVTTSMNLNSTDSSKAVNLSNQAMRISFNRDPSATGGVTYFDSILTATAFLNADTPFLLRGLNLEAPRVAAGKTLARFEAIHVEGALAGGSITQNYALLTEPGAGNVGIGTGSPQERLEVAGNVKISGGAMIFPDGTRQSTAASGVSGAPISLTQTSAGTSDPLSGNVTTAKQRQARAALPPEWLGAVRALRAWASLE
jgi:hypothetical protein